MKSNFWQDPTLNWLKSGQFDRFASSVDWFTGYTVRPCGWPATLGDDEILERLVALNAQRAAEEAQGLVRWLWPDFQKPATISEKQHPLSLAGDDEADEDHPAAKARKRKAAAAKEKAAGKADPSARRDWPKGRAAQAKGVLTVLRDGDGPVTADELAQRFTRAPREAIDELLQALVTLGQARRTRGGRYTS